MRNHIQPGNSLDFVADATGAVSGKTKMTGGIIHIPSTTAAEGQAYAGDLVGCFQVDAATGQSWAFGVKLFWDDAAKVWTTVATGNTAGARAIAAKQSAAATGDIRLYPTL